MNELQVKTMEQAQVIEKVFELEQRKAKAMIQSQILPQTFRNIGDVIVLNEMSRNLQIPVILLSQQLYIVYGKVGFSGQFAIALLNKAMEMEKLNNWKYEERKDGAIRVVGERKNEKIEGIWIDEDLVKRNDWNSNSHWKKNFALMARYRSATWFLRMYFPEMLMGLYSTDELKDVELVENGKTEKQVKEVEVIDPLKIDKNNVAKVETKKDTDAKVGVKNDYENNEQNEVKEEILEVVTKDFLRVYYSKLNKEQKVKFLQVKGDANFDEMTPEQLKNFYMEAKDEIDRMGS